jgi:hypothetical protein
MRRSIHIGRLVASSALAACTAPNDNLQQENTGEASERFITYAPTDPLGPMISSTPTEVPARRGGPNDINVRGGDRLMGSKWMKAASHTLVCNAAFCRWESGWIQGAVQLGNWTHCGAPGVAPSWKLCSAPGPRGNLLRQKFEKVKLECGISPLVHASPPM